MEQLILEVRQKLISSSILGERGALAVRERLLSLEPITIETVPSTATINRILKRHGVFDGRVRVRRPPPPAGWHLPEISARRAELDQFDGVEGLFLEGGEEVYVLNAVSLHGGLVGSWPTNSITSEFTCKTLVTHWREHGLPAYVQFDNGLAFTGPRQYLNAIGTVIRLCLSLGVTPVFVPKREFGFQANVESYNNLWQQKVWQRTTFESASEVEFQSNRYVVASRKKRVVRIEGSPVRRPFPSDWVDPTDWTKPLPINRAGKMIFLRRSDGKGDMEILLNSHHVSDHWPNRLVRCVIDLAKDKIQFYGLRRQAPAVQNLLKEVKFHLPEQGSKVKKEE